MTIDHDIPLPPPGYGKGRARSELGREVRLMGVGDSRFCDSESIADAVRGIAYHAGFNVAKRKVGGGWRVWRTE